MTLLDLVKATVVCGAGAFLNYSFPLLSQILVIGVLGLLWLLYVQQTFTRLRRR